MTSSSRAADELLSLVRVEQNWEHEILGSRDANVLVCYITCSLVSESSDETLGTSTILTTSTSFQSQFACFTLSHHVPISFLKLPSLLVNNTKEWRLRKRHWFEIQNSYSYSTSFSWSNLKVPIIWRSMPENEAFYSKSWFASTRVLFSSSCARMAPWREKGGAHSVQYERSYFCFSIAITERPRVKIIELGITEDGSIFWGLIVWGCVTKEGQLVALPRA